MTIYGSVADFHDCAKPLIFENGDPTFPYSMQGTCFLVRVGMLPYLVTARHCLVGRELDSLRIRVRPGKLEFVRLSAVRYPTGKGDRADLAVFEIKRDSVSKADLMSNHFLDLQRYRLDAFVLRESSILALVGYPSEMNTITYEDYSIMTGGISMDGRYCGPAEERGCSKIRINNFGPLGNMDGLSGSPVLEFTPAGGKFYRPQLAGVLIRGTSASMKGSPIRAIVNR